jgi:hypothetical protein
MQCYSQGFFPSLQLIATYLFVPISVPFSTSSFEKEIHQAVLHFSDNWAVAPSIA